MLTNTRILELRAAARECQREIDRGTATDLATDYCELFELLRKKIGDEKNAVDESMGVSLLLLVD